MRVTLVRHGAAGGASRDADRGLTVEGRLAVRRVGKALRARDEVFDVVVTSPLVRAVQTAEIVCERIRHAGEVLIDRALVPEASPQLAIDLMDDLATQRSDLLSVALVGHEPHLSALAAALLGQSRHRGFGKGEAMRIRLPGPAAQAGGKLRWTVNPDSGELLRVD